MTRVPYWRALVCALVAVFAGRAQAEITFPDSVFSNLDYGLYWFGYVDAQKAVPGQLNNYYDKNKKTVIYIHGWQNNSVTRGARETLDRRASGGPAEDLSQYWLDRGYNVGILYWNQFADEGEVQDAEAKIYTASGPRNMRWKRLDGSYQSGPNTSVGQLLFEAIRDNMADFNHSHLRIAGHSLGNQVALDVSKRLHDAVNAGQLSANLRPDRVALLDPFYSNGAKSYLGGQWPGEIARESANALISAGVAIETYRSSPVTSTAFIGDSNTALLNKTAFSELKPWNFNFWQLTEKHLAAVTWYFWSRAFSTLDVQSTSLDAPSASSTDSQIRTLMNQSWGVIQDQGAYTGSPADDNFKKRNR